MRRYRELLATTATLLAATGGQLATVLVAALSVAGLRRPATPTGR